MGFQQRQRWVFTKVLETFGTTDLTESSIETVMRQDQNIDMLNGFLKGNGPSKLFVLYQARDVQNENGEWVTPSQEPELMVSTGENIKLRSKCCYFLRNTKDSRPVDLTKGSDLEVIHGELSASPLESMEGNLSQLYKPMFDKWDSWGKAENYQLVEFQSEMERFISGLREALKSLVGGLELRKPDHEYDALDMRNYSQRAAQDPDMVTHFEELLEEWCNEIESYLDMPDPSSGPQNSEAGPMTELEYWRHRMQRLTSITEQLKTKECKMVIGVLSALTKNAQDQNRQKVFALLRRWKQIDLNITEAANEAKDNVKYLFTLEKFIEPLYTGTPTSIIDTLPALMNSIKMIHTIARYYNTTERMTNLFVKVTNQMIVNCKQCINGKDSFDKLWDKDPEDLVHQLESCLKLNEAYQEQYRLTKDKLMAMPKGKQFDFNEMQIFGKFDLFCRRIIKLIDMFSTIDQFSSLSEHRLEGMESLIDQFHSIIKEFKLKRHDLLDYHNNKFDRDYVEFNVRISDLEGLLQGFINASFESITSIEHSLNLLRKFQTILQRENLKSDLDSKFNVIFQNYGLELEQVQQLYEKHKHNPPIPRNLPPVAGNITWSRHLLKRIEEPMRKFESNQNVLASKDSKRIIRTYNKVARTLVAFEYLWYQAWVQSIDTAKAGLQATLIIRHPDDGKLYVNFDQEILQLIREAKCLDRMGIEIPESAKIVLLQEDKFKNYYNHLQYALSEYDRVVSGVIPVTAMLLRPHFNDMEYKLRPGMITLTWTSMNIDAYKHHIHAGLQKLEELVHNINDIIENRVEKNLKIVSKTMLVDLPANQSFSLEEFVVMQERHIVQEASMLQGKNVEIENAVEDLIKIICAYPLDAHVEPVAPEEVQKLKQHYNHFMYQALLHCTKNSLNSIKKRVASRAAGGSVFMLERPFFEVDVQLAPPNVQLVPSLDEIQRAINVSAQAVLKCSKTLYDWGEANHSLPVDERRTFFERITKDIEIVRVALLLTGSVQGTRNSVAEYLDMFRKYDWLWKESKQVAYDKFMTTSPQLDDYERELKSFVDVEHEISLVPSTHVIGALSLNTNNLKLQLKYEGSQWKVQYSDNLHGQARTKMEALTEYMRVTMGKLNRDVVDLDSLRFIMNLLKEVRDRESGINMEINPVMDMYAMLEYYLPSGFMDKEEMDQKSVLRSNWKKLVQQASARTDELSKTQLGFKQRLLRDIKEFMVDVMQFRADFLANGPMVQGINPLEAVERLTRFKEEFKIRERKYELYSSGEELFALPKTEYAELDKTKKELRLSDQLFGLYMDVVNTMEEWKFIPWTHVVENIANMTEKMESFLLRCKKMPSRLREWDAYKTLRTEIEDFHTVLPLLQELSKESIMPRHWQEIMRISGSQFEVGGPDFKLQTLLDINMVAFKDEVEEITEGADKQLKIYNNLEEIKERWGAEEFQFQDWQSRNVAVLKGVVPIVEELEEAQLQLQTMLTMRHVSPFREEVQAKLQVLSDTSDTLERWLKVQMLWCSLESVFTGGDIARQMPLEAKKFAKIDKDWSKIMAKAVETCQVVACCSNELLRTSLPVMYAELEKCQKSLEGYLEQKRNKFPRFYFVSNPVLLLILSQGSDPLSMNQYYEKVFDSIAQVTHNRSDKTIIEKIISPGVGGEIVPFSTPVRAVGSIEDWLAVLLSEMQRTMKDICRACAADIGVAGGDISALRGFVDNYVAQFGLLGIQLMWTTDVQGALEQCKVRKNVMKEVNQKCLAVLLELSSWCLQDLGARQNRTKIETLVTVHVHQRDVMNELTTLYKQKKLSDANDFEWLKQARFAWRADARDNVTEDGACIISITDVDFQYQYEYLGSKERLVITPLTDRCYITLAQALGMYFGGAPAGPAGTGKTETVKDLGRTLGIYVVVTNCTDQQRYTDCAKIFKGLCQGGLWGCFDEFNRIQLPVLSVVAQQVLAIQNAKKTGVTYFQFPGDPQNILLSPVCGFFITMNPGYAGRQELPENLKALFRGVAMMVPDREIIMKVKLCSVGYVDYAPLSKKFFVLYGTSEEQLSKQKHYDFGLRNILSVLRTAGKTKRDNLDKPESVLLYQTLRDMNLSKLVAQDVPLFLSLLADLFPSTASPPKGTYPEEESALRVAVEGAGLIYHDGWVSKVIQLHETALVRHGIMLVGPTGGGKSKIFTTLAEALSSVMGITHKLARLNPKAIRAAEMYGEVDPMSGEWTTGVFAAMWAKYNRRENKFNTWIVADGPVDAIWIEDLNTVLDDNRILTLANGDRIPMTDNVKLMFEVENLANASPATVSRAGIVYVSDTDLDWAPVVESWINSRPNDQQEILRPLFTKFVGDNTPVEVGHTFNFLTRNTNRVMSTSRVGSCANLYTLFTCLLSGGGDGTYDVGTGANMADDIERIFLYCLIWSLGGLLEAEDRLKFDEYLRSLDDNEVMPDVEEGETIYEYYIDTDTMAWEKWRPPKWNYPKGDKLDFSNLLVPTMDSTRALNLLRSIHRLRHPVLLVGGPGTAKTSTALMFFGELNPDKMLVKRVNFSSATTPNMFQVTVEGELDKRGGKNFGPPSGKKMTLFLDDLSMPLVNDWGDQPTLEIVRLIVDYGGFCFLDKDKRGDFKVCEDLQYVAAMGHPGGGMNDIPNRLKRLFFSFNLVLPSIVSINDIYGQMLNGRFTTSEFDQPALAVANKLTHATIILWRTTKTKMLPTPAKFHYVFNMRELSRVFQGILLTPKDTIKTGGIRAQNGLMPPISPAVTLIALWRHECDRVFCDKLTNNKDKDWYYNYMNKLVLETFGESLASQVPDRFYMVNFLREDVYDEDGVLEEEAPKVYEPGGTLDDVRQRVMHFLNQHNTDNPAKKMDLVLFDDAAKHLLRISRLLEMPRGSVLLVGVGGSGKQSLTRLASYISRATCFQITLTKVYNVGSLMDDLRLLYKSAGHLQKQTVFLFTDSEIKQEIFLEYINSILMTGEVPGLFAKDEMMAMTADLRNAFIRNRPGMQETQDNLKQYFIDSVRDNLHVVLCMSPLNPKFPERARKFPGLVSGPTIDWFLPWPEEALVSVSRGFVGEFPMECDEQVKSNLMVHMGMVHKLVTEVCDEYYLKMRRHVYQTPKSYLSFIQNYKTLYTQKLSEIKVKEQRVNLGLKKLIGGAEDVEAMKLVLADEQVKLEVATEETNKMLGSLEVSSLEAKKEGDQVAKIKGKCEDDARRIAAEKAACESDLAKAQPFVEEAETAIDSIKPAHIGEIKKLPKPSDIIKLVFDGVLLLFKSPMNSVKPFKLTVAKKEINFIETSYAPFAQQVMGDTRFLANIKEFGASEKDKINEETIELLCPIMDLEGFLPQVAKNASQAAEGLCTWVRAMKFYHEASKIVKPKLEALAIAEGQMDAANKALAGAEARLEGCKNRLQDLQTMFETQMAEKKRIEEGAQALARKMTQASELIGGLAGERVRWTEDSNNFADLKRRLVGDCAVACAFVSYLGPFNQEFRKYLINDKFTADCETRAVPVTRNMPVIDFLVDVGTIGDWNMEGLPTDPLSIQNGILVTRSSRYPLLIDPQGQAVTWIRKREEDHVPPFGITSLNHPKLKDQLEFSMSEGKALIVTGVEEEIDPMLDPVLEKQIMTKGKSKFINVADKNVEYSDNFRMYFVTRLPNPHFSPELQAKTTVVDFTVTQKGLEEQLLGRVIGREQKALEDQLNQVLEEVNANTKSLLQLDAMLLERLTSNDGNLLEDEELIGVLGNTKAKAAEVKQKLVTADETKSSINEKREQFRPVATRGSVMYFVIVEMSLVNCMYQVSLDQFLEIFMKSMDVSEKASLASKRVQNIIETMTYMAYRYINRGLYEKDKLTFVLLITMKILVTANLLSPSDVALFLRGGAALDINSVRRKPFSWLSNDAWLNVIELSQSNRFFGSLPNDMSGNEAMWRRWYDDNEPEQMVIPDYENRLSEKADIGPFLKLLLVRSLRMDRSILTIKEFIRNTQQMGPRFVQPVTDTIESIFEDMTARTPVIFLLSVGADPTESIELLARKKKIVPPATVSLGEGQGPVAIKAMNAAAVNGTWVLLQNCELGLDLMDQMEDFLGKLAETVDAGFRLFITALPNPQFPLGLLQMSTKVTNEPPNGLKASLLRSYTVMVDQDRLERVETAQWRQLLFNLCFIHSVVLERRKFGPLGWCIPYEYNAGDLSACVQFLEKHLYNGPISWPTLQYMVTEAQYGGKITDDLDRRMFNSYGNAWIGPSVCHPDFTYNPSTPIFRMPNDFVYRCPSDEQIDAFRNYCSGFPEIDSPEIFGLHPNADLTYRVKEVTAMLNTLGETQPKGGGGGGGASREDVVYEKATDLLERLPEDYIEDDYKARINKLGGLAVPLNIFLFQEIQRLQRVIAKVRSTLTSMQMAIRGEVVMTEELQGVLDAVFDAKVPKTWLFTPGGDEFSWILPTLGLWFSSLVSRNEQNRTWLTTGRPNCYWMTGFFNPQGFLTAMKQEVTRRHKADKWALDDVAYHTEVTNYTSVESVKVAPAEGVYIHGLFMDGAAWSKHDGSVIESEPKKLFASLPVLYVSGNLKPEEIKVKREMFGALGPYECPCYKYFARTDRYLIFMVNLRTSVQAPQHWTLRGVALLCSTD